MDARTPFPFDPVNGPKLLIALGYEVEHADAFWEDVGDAENGPRLAGHDAYEAWSRPVSETATQYIIVQDGQVVEVGLTPSHTAPPLRPT